MNYGPSSTACARQRPSGATCHGGTEKTFENVNKRFKEDFYLLKVYDILSLKKNTVGPKRLTNCGGCSETAFFAAGNEKEAEAKTWAASTTGSPRDTPHRTKS